MDVPKLPLNSDHFKFHVCMAQIVPIHDMKSFHDIRMRESKAGPVGGVLLMYRVFQCSCTFQITKRTEHAHYLNSNLLSFWRGSRRVIGTADK